MSQAQVTKMKRDNISELQTWLPSPHVTALPGQLGGSQESREKDCDEKLNRLMGALWHSSQTNLAVSQYHAHEKFQELTLWERAFSLTMSAI